MKKSKGNVVYIGLVAVVAWLYYLFYFPPLWLNDKTRLIYIHSGWSFNDVKLMLKEKDVISGSFAFIIYSTLKNYKSNVKPGRYRVAYHISVAHLVRFLRSGAQEPEFISIRNIRTTDELAEILINKMESDSATIFHTFNDNDFLKRFGFTSLTLPALFIPGTYSFLWTDTPEEFIEQMHKIYEDFWTQERRSKAAGERLTPLQVSILASILEAEQSVYDDEKPVIAGLYINRLRKNIPLQSDPTLVFARGDFTILRVLEGDKKVNSPYNTYMHTGLPPGPITIPRTSSIDAVLNYIPNDYLYMCADADHPGRHHFSKTLEEQNIYAQKYRASLDKRNIMR